MSHNRNRLIGGFEEAVEKGQGAIKKSTKNTASDFVSTAKNQVTGGATSDQYSSIKPDQGTNEANVSSQDANSSQMSDEDRVKFLRDLYGADLGSNNSQKEKKDDKSKGSGDVTQALGVPQKDPHEGLTPEEIAKLEAARRQLHGDYYQEFLAKTRRKEEPVKDKIEREEQAKKLEDLNNQEKQNKKAALNPAIHKVGTAEAAVGTVG